MAGIDKKEDYNTPGDSMNGDFDGSDERRAENGYTDRSANVESQVPRGNDAGVDSGGSRRNDHGNDNREEDEEGNGGNLLFSCQCDSARTIATLLSCLRRVVTAGNAGPSNFSGGNTQSATQRGTQSTSAMALSGASANKIQHATVYAGPNGLTFHVQHGLAKQSQCSVDMPKGLFREYFVGEEEVWLEDSDAETENDEGAELGENGTQQGGNKEVIQGGEFGVNLTTVLECFSILSKTGSKPSAAPGGGSGPAGAGGSGNKSHLGEYASLSSVPLCMSYDRGTATFHLEFLEGGSISSTGGEAATSMGGGGCLVMCEVPGVAVADDVDEGPDDGANARNGINTNNNSGLASAFRGSPLLSRAILYSDALQSAVSELYDVPGANIVQISLSSKGIELGTVGPRSECWVDVPYHRGQGGMYVGLECYKPNVPLFGVGDRNDIVQRYPLGAFLSGMRGLDIGVETCVSVNARGMMAIQHQVSRDGYYDLSEDSKGGSVRPSFVDFIMTCIEEEEDENDENTMVSQDNASVQMSQQHEQHNGLLDITNNGHTDMEDVSSGVRKKARDVVARVARTMSGRGRANSAVAASTAREELSASEEEEDKGPSRKTGRKGKHCDNYAERDGDFGGNGKNVDFGQDEYEHQNADGTAHADSKRQNNEAASRILGELKMDTDMLSSRRDDADAAGQGIKNALEDIRRRRQERLQRRQSLEMQTNNEQSEDDDDDNDNHRRKSYDSNVSQKRRAKSSKAGSRKKQCSSEEEEEDEHDNRHCDQSDGDDDELNNGSQSRHSKQRQHSNPAQDSQSQSEDDDEDDDEDDESDHEDSLDVTADIPHLFSKRSSLSTSRHDRGRSRRSNSRGSNRTSKGGSMSDDDDGAGADSDEEVEQEPRMMYGDTKLEFTQDGYDSD